MDVFLFYLIYMPALLIISSSELINFAFLKPNTPCRKATLTEIRRLETKPQGRRSLYIPKEHFICETPLLSSDIRSSVQEKLLGQIRATIKKGVYRLNTLAKNEKILHHGMYAFYSEGLNPRLNATIKSWVMHEMMRYTPVQRLSWNSQIVTPMHQIRMTEDYQLQIKYQQAANWLNLTEKK